MANVCIIYAHEDRKHAEWLDIALTRHGWSVWWDERLLDGPLSEQIQNELNQTNCVLVLWSKNSVNKVWVCDEARYTLEIKKPLLPVKLGTCVIPVGLGHLQTIQIDEWTGEADHHIFRKLRESVERHCGPPKAQWNGKPARELEIEKKNLQLPAFFRSVSSYETQLLPEAAMQLLQMLNTETVLLSAYDLVNAKNPPRIRSAIKKLRQNKSVVMVDSGNYESYRKQDLKWNRRKLKIALNAISFDYAFCFDNLKPPSKLSSIVKDVVSRTKADQAMAPHGQILPILHIPTSKSGGFKTEMAAELFTETASKLNVHFIAVPERELGSGLLEKAKAVWAIRQKLNEMGHYQPIHLLGTGNPLSVAVFAAVGADSFDGLEWCRTVADFETGYLFHHQQYDFFRDQTRTAEQSLVKLAADDDEISYSAKVGLHNLEFFNNWIRDVRRHLHSGTMDVFLKSMLPGRFFAQLQRAIPQLEK